MFIKHTNNISLIVMDQNLLTYVKYLKQIYVLWFMSVSHLENIINLR